MMLRARMKVVCVDDIGASQLVLGKVYTIKSVEGPLLGRWRGKVGQYTVVHLDEAKPEDRFYGFHSSRFRPAVERKTDISIFKKMLTPNKTKTNA